MSQRVYTRVLLQHTRYRYLYFSLYYDIQGTSIIVSSELISEALNVPRVVRSTYPSHPYLHSISRDELAIHFCEMAMVWGGLQNFTTHDFAKGLRILNMVMTFVLTPRSHYNIITEPQIGRAHV